jgi:hypothetical protein
MEWRSFVEGRDRSAGRRGIFPERWGKTWMRDYETGSSELELLNAADNGQRCHTPNAMDGYEVFKAIHPKLAIRPTGSAPSDPASENRQSAAEPRKTCGGCASGTCRALTTAGR